MGDSWATCVSLRGGLYAKMTPEPADSTDTAAEQDSTAGCPSNFQVSFHNTDDCCCEASFEGVEELTQEMEDQFQQAFDSQGCSDIEGRYFTTTCNDRGFIAASFNDDQCQDNRNSDF